MEKSIPVTVVTGFLGAGKTSMINHLIHSRREDWRFAVIVNEFGALGIDGGLIAQSDDDVIELSNGCLCCEVRGDLIAACERLWARRGQFDSLIIETSGVADPAPVAQSFLVADGPGERYQLTGLVTLVDAVHGADQLAQDPIAQSQVAMADRLIVTKSDLALPKEIALLSDLIRRFNDQAELVMSAEGQMASDALLRLDAYSLDGLATRLGGAMAPVHDPALGSVSFTFERPFDFTRFSVFIRQLMIEKGKDLLRVKGVLSLTGEDRKFVFHGVQTLVDGDVTGPWGSEPRESRLVLIGRRLDRGALQAGLLACLD